MPLRWKIFRIICIVQLIAASVNLLQKIFYFFLHISFGNIAGILLFIAIILLCILGINLVNNNYPEEPVQDKQKKIFNRLFLLNFILLSFLFGFIIAEMRSLNQFAFAIGKSFIEIPFGLFLMLLVYLFMLIFQLIILYGLYQLRLELYSNFMKRKFEFEKA
ncbi:MAG: hypothetical protein ABI675_03205 [Chitinophagaceae bacterium]